jgi:hypothetical protein
LFFFFLSFFFWCWEWKPSPCTPSLKLHLGALGSFSC